MAAKPGPATTRPRRGARRCRQCRWPIPAVPASRPPRASKANLRPSSVTAGSAPTQASDDYGVQVGRCVAVVVRARAACWTASPGAAKWRRVGQIEVADLLDRGAVGDGGGQNVDALGDLGADVAQQLRAKQPPAAPVAGQARRAAAPGSHHTLPAGPWVDVRTRVVTPGR